MVAGPRGGYMDYEARERELDAEASRRSKEQHHHHLAVRHRDADRRRDGGRSKGGRDVANGHGRRRSLSPRSRLVGRLGDLEPGEVLSGSASDDSGGRPRRGRENGIPSSSRLGASAASVAAGAVVSSPSKKRKFSPIIWDRDSPKPSHSDAGRGKKVVESVTDELPLPPPLLPKDHVPVRLHVEKSRMDVEPTVGTESVRNKARHGCVQGVRVCVSRSCVWAPAGKLRRGPARAQHGPGPGRRAGGFGSAAMHRVTES